jgi:hypothetical protein
VKAAVRLIGALRCAVCGDRLVGACKTTNGRHFVGVLTAEQRARLIAPRRRTWREQRLASLLVATVALLLLSGCSSDADVASDNLSKAAEQFEIERRVVFFNGITDTYLLTIEGRCSVEDDGGQLEVTCKIGPDQFKKHFLGLSDNVTYFVEQSEAADADEYRYRVIFKPEVLVPDVDLATS